MELLWIRHGEASYAYAEERGYIGHGFDLAPLTERGRAQAAQAAGDRRLAGVELVVSSPYTRALQTAAVISRARDVDIAVEQGLHEWIPDLTFTYSTAAQSHRAGALCMENRGTCPPDCGLRYEEFSAVFRRAKSSLLPYLERYQKIAVVSHGYVIRQFTGQVEIANCEILPMEFTADTPWKTFEEQRG